MIRFLSILLLAAICIPPTLIAQPGTWRSYPIPSRVNDLIERDGRLWAATDAGIFQISLATGEVEGHLTKANAGLPSNEVEAFAVHPETHVPFIGTYDLALAFLTPSGQWQRIEFPDFVTAQAQDNMVLTYCMEFDHQGRLWVGTNVGLLRYDTDGWTHYTPSGSNAFLGSVWSMSKDENGDILAASHVVYRVEDDIPHLFSPSPAEAGNFQLFSYGDAELFSASNGDVYFFTDIGRIGRYRDGSWDVYNPSEELMTGHRAPLSVYELPGGTLAAYYKDANSFAYFDGEEWTVEPLQSETPLTGAYVHENAELRFTTNQVLLHREGNVIAQPLYSYPVAGPVNLFKPDCHDQLWAYDGSDILRNLDTGDTLHCRYNGQNFQPGQLAFTPQGDVWTIAWVNLYHRSAGGEWELWNHANSPLPQKSLTRMTTDALGRVWVFVHTEGLYRFDGQEWKHYTQPVFSSQFMYALTPGAGGDIWFSSSTSGQPLTVGRFDGESLQTFTAANSGFNLDYALSLAYDAGTNRLWAGGNTDRAQYYDGNTWHTEYFPLQAAGHEWIRHIQVRDGYAVMASSNRVLLFTDDGWEEFNTANSPLSSGQIYAIGLDAGNALWISHNQPAGIDIYETGLLSTGTRDLESEARAALALYPNPVQEALFLSLNCPADASQARLRIFGADGRLVSEQSEALTPGACQIELNVAGLLPGLYMVLVEMGRERLMGRFVKS